MEPDNEIKSRAYLESQITLLLQRDAELHNIQRKFEQSADRLLALQKINRLLIATTRIEEGLRDTARILASEMSFEKVAVILRSENGTAVVAQSGYSKEEEARLRDSSAHDLERIVQALRAEQMAMLVDMRSSDQFVVAGLEPFSLESFLIAPIRDGEVVIGALLAGYSQEHAAIFSETLLLDKQDTAWFSGLSFQISAMIANVRLISGIHQEQARLLASIKSLPLGVALLDRDLAFVAINEKMQEFFAEPTRGMIASLNDIVARLPKKIGERDFDLKALCVQVMQSKAMIEVEEIPLVNEVYRLFITPILAATNGIDEAIGTVVLFEDITKQKQLDRSKSAFLAIASHEMRTPLTVIRGNAELLLESIEPTPENAETRKFLEGIVRNGVRLLGILHDFIDVIHLEEDHTGLRREVFDLAAMTKEVISDVQSIAVEKKLKLELTIPSEIAAMVVGDSDKVRQIVMNLVANAIQYTERGGVSVAIGEHMESGKRFVKMAVTDTGIGIAPENQNMLFKKFSTVQETFMRTQEYGSGLGLYISRLLVESMGGSIYLEKSTPGEGSTFSVVFPAAIS